MNNDKNQEQTKLLECLKELPDEYKNLIKKFADSIGTHLKQIKNTDTDTPDTESDHDDTDKQ